MGQYLIEWRQHLERVGTDEWRYVTFNKRKHRDDFLLRLIARPGVGELTVMDDEDYTAYMENYSETMW